MSIDGAANRERNGTDARGGVGDIVRAGPEVINPQMVITCARSKIGAPSYRQVYRQQGSARAQTNGRRTEP